MKKIFACLAGLSLAGCAETAQEVKDTVAEAPVEFWDSLKEVLSFVVDILVNLLTGWLGGILG